MISFAALADDSQVISEVAHYCSASPIVYLTAKPLRLMDKREHKYSAYDYTYSELFCYGKLLSIIISQNGETEVHRRQ